MKVTPCKPYRGSNVCSAAASFVQEPEINSKKTQEFTKENK